MDQREIEKSIPEKDRTKAAQYVSQVTLLSVFRRLEQLNPNLRIAKQIKQVPQKEEIDLVDCDSDDGKSKKENGDLSIIGSSTITQAPSAVSRDGSTFEPTSNPETEKALLSQLSSQQKESLLLHFRKAQQQVLQRFMDKRLINPHSLKFAMRKAFGGINVRPLIDRISIF